MAQFLDNRGRLFGRLSVVDLFVVLVLVSLVVFGFLRYSTNETDLQRVRLTLVAERLRDVGLVSIEAGQAATDEVGTSLGTVVSVSFTPTMAEVVTPDGRLVLAESPLYQDAKVVVEGDGRASSSTVSVGGLPLRVGKTIVLVGPGYEARFQIRGVELVGG
ncbi:MAG: DUF4330 domain-containing protein [Actinobacteria bacterium]|nr:DUF4330 domain-containing protein [Actinomycetota bacterium]